MEGVFRKVPGRIQPSRPGRLPQRIVLQRPAHRDGSTTSGSSGSGGNSSGCLTVGASASESDEAATASTAGASTPADAATPPPAPAASSPWMGLVLPALSKNVGVAAAAVRSCEVIALPTDTLYGFAGDASSATAVQRIYDLKQRDTSKPLPICVADIADVARYAITEHLPAGLLESLLPGPVTLVLPIAEQSTLPRQLLAGRATVGVRIPNAAFVRSVAREFGGALALTSANVSAGKSSTRVDEFGALWAQCACIFDAGQLPAGRAGSTVVELLGGGNVFRVIRAGSAEEPTKVRLRALGLTQVE